MDDLKDLIDALGPAHHADEDRVSRSKMLGEAPPCRALFGHMQDGIGDLKIGESPIAAGHGRALSLIDRA